MRTQDKSILLESQYCRRPLRARSPMVCESYYPEVLPGVAEGKEKWGSNTAMIAYNRVWAEPSGATGGKAPDDSQGRTVLKQTSC